LTKKKECKTKKKNLKKNNTAKNTFLKLEKFKGKLDFSFKAHLKI